MAEAQGAVASARNEVRARENDLRSKDQEIRSKDNEIRLKDSEIRAMEQEIQALAAAREDVCGLLYCIVFHCFVCPHALQGRRAQAKIAELERDNIRIKEQLTQTYNAAHS